eukprot:gene2784-8142_t
MNENAASAIAGSVSGAVSRLVVTPLDVVKIRLQLQVESFQHTSPGRYKGFLHCVRNMYTHEGIFGFWKDNVWINFIAGCVGAAAATLSTYPLDVVRTRMATQGEPKVYRTFIHSLVTITQTEGLFALYRGLGPTLIGVMPYVGMSFAVYIGAKEALASRNFFKQQVISHDSLESLSSSQSTSVMSSHSSSSDKAIAGAVAGVVSKTIVHPIDIIKKRFQVVGFERERTHFGFGQTAAYTSTWNALKTILQKEGIRGCFKGLLPSLIKSAPSSAITLAVYDSLRLLLMHHEL